MSSWQGFSGLNRGYVLELYERFRRDPASVDPETRALFERWTPPVEDVVDETPLAADPSLLRKAVSAVSLARAIRRYGHLAAQIDPLGRPRHGDPSLLPETHGVTEADLRALPATLIPSPLAETASNMYETVEAFRRLYCSTTGYDYAHVFVPKEREWLRQA